MNAEFFCRSCTRQITLKCVTKKRGCCSVCHAAILAGEIEDKRAPKAKRGPRAAWRAVRSPETTAARIEATLARYPHLRRP